MNHNNLPGDCNINNTWNLSRYNDVAQAILWSRTEDILFTIGLPVIFCVGVVGNLSFLFALLRVPAMRTVTNAYLANVAAADLWFITWTFCLYLPIYYISPVRNDVPWTSNIGCGIVLGFSYLGYYASVMLITIVTAERYFAICRPFQHRMIAGKKHTLQMIYFSWITAIILFAITLPSWSSIVMRCIIWPDTETYRDFPTQIWQCSGNSPASPNFKVFVIGEIIGAVLFYIIVPVNIFMYGSIIYTLSKRTETFADKQKTELATRTRNQVARLLIVNGSVFLLCQAPYRVINIHYFTLLATGQGLLSLKNYGIIILTSRLLVLLNSCCNPFIYLTTSSFYRKAFREAFCGKISDPGGSSRISGISGRSKESNVA
ncbi:neuromedin-U receptor 2-like [Amphiura filiformis]|uniref:neuromedin-U receptor 2-like n=1 Tax=Amphiura filiformis TaxID=82378 RepID=UPI003B20D4B7